MIYKIILTQSAKEDVKEMKRYILEKFKYRETAENFSRKIKKIIYGLELFPAGYTNTKVRYREYEVYLKADRSYLIFYIINENEKQVIVLRVMQDGMNWQSVLRKWIQEMKNS